MSAASQSPPSQNRTEGRAAPPRVHAEPADAEPRLAFRTALARYKGPRLAAIRLAQGAAPGGTRIRPVGNADEITEHLDQPAAVEALVARLDSGSRLALSLFDLIETTSISLAGLVHTLGILGAEPIDAIVKLLELGLLAIEPSAELGPVDDFRSVLERGSSSRLRLRAHPAVINGVRPSPPDVAPPAVSAAIRQIRESDGLEPILRLGALWQRVGSRALAPDPSGNALQARPRPAHGRPRPGLLGRRCAQATGPITRAVAGAGDATWVLSNKTRPATGYSRLRRNSGTTTRSTCPR